MTERTQNKFEKKIFQKTSKKEFESAGLFWVSRVWANIQSFYFGLTFIHFNTTVKKKIGLYNGMNTVMSSSEDTFGFPDNNFSLSEWISMKFFKKVQHHKRKWLILGMMVPTVKELGAHKGPKTSNFLVSG